MVMVINTILECSMCHVSVQKRIYRFLEIFAEKHDSFGPKIVEEKINCKNPFLANLRRKKKFLLPLSRGGRV